MKRILYVLAAMMMFISGCGWDEESSTDVADISKSELLLEHNRQRGLNRIEPQLKSDPELEKRAQAWAEHMATHNRFYHSSLSGTKFGWMGENIAWGQPNIDKVMDAWMHSSGHRANILDHHYTYAGFGIARSANNRLYWCVQFGGN